jgi:uncharacterized protein with ACT and thioredoxin-like domain
VRLSVVIMNRPGALHELTGAISGLGANIVGMGHLLGKTAETNTLMVKVSGAKLEDLQKAVKPVVEEIVDIRDCD